MVELLFAHHLMRLLLKESVLDDGVRVIDGSELGPYRYAGCEPEALFFQVVGCASYCKSV